ncbi:hypothetical protein BDF19DRAFT_417542 [Syncephalis fuscata]|nr:hypothetical protein BDF19DRAFT_417542 [Syncephalis fuscata]
MFGFLKSNTSSQKGENSATAVLSPSSSSRGRTNNARQQQASLSPEALLADLNVDFSLDTNVSDHDLDDVDDADLDDPELLAQLAALSVDTSKPTRQAKPQAQKATAKSANIDWNVLDDIHKTAITTADDDDEDVEITEEDMQDPHLLAELQNLTQSSHVESTTATSTNSQTNQKQIYTSDNAFTSTTSSVHIESETATATLAMASDRPDPPNDIIVKDTSEDVAPIEFDPMADQLDILDEIEVETDRLRSNRSYDIVSQGLDRMKQKIDAARRINNSVIEDAAQDAVKRIETYLATLPKSKLSGSSTSIVNTTSTSEKIITVDTIVQKEATSTSVSENTDIRAIIEQELATHLNNCNITEIEQAIRQYKIQAVQAKRSDQSDVAMLYLRASKQLTAHMTSCTNTTSNETVVNNTESALITTTDRPVLDGELLNVRLQAYKVAALESKRAGNMTQARECLMVVKQLQSIAEQHTSGIEVTDFIMPPPPSPSVTATNATETINTPTVSTTSHKTIETSAHSTSKSVHTTLPGIPSTDITTPSSLNQISTLSYDQIEKRLADQIQLATTVAAYAYRRGDKETALQFHKIKKNLVADTESIVSLRAHNQPLPLITYQEMAYTLETCNDDLDSNELELVLHKAWNLHGAREATSGPMDVFVQWDSGLDSGKGTSPTVTKQREPVFDYQAKQTIQRNRVLQRHFERKKITFDVMSYRGFLRGSACIGRATLKLDGLLKCSTVEEVIPLYEPNSRRETGGQLQVSLRLRTPLLGAQIVKYDERWLFLSHIRDTGSTTATVTNTTTNITNNSISSSNNSNAATIKVVSHSNTLNTTNNTAPSSIKAITNPSNSTPITNVPTTTTNQDDALETLLTEFDSVENIKSNMVLEAEQERIQTLLQSKPFNSDELRDRLQAVQIKLNMLVLQVQTGALTLPTYIQSVRQCADQTKQQAILFKRSNRMDKAREALNRLKIMQQEIAEVEQAGLV